MKIIKQLTALIAAIVGLTPAFAHAQIVPFNQATDCSLLSQPKTILLVHASWCFWCKKFMPVYMDLANNPKYKDWIFYTLQDDEGEAVCGVQPEGVPTVYINNMKELDNANADGVLAKYLDEHNKNVTPPKNICTI